MLDLLSQELKEVAKALLNNNITLNEAQDALKAVRLLEKAGIPQKDWQRLSKATDKLSAPEFKEAALKLLRLEEATGMEYKRAIARFQELEADTVLKEEKRRELDEEISDNTSIIEGLQSLNSTLADTGITARNVASNLRKLISS